MGASGRSNHRVKYAELFDAELRAHNERFRAAASSGPNDRVLDIGCGTGETTREAGRAASHGSAHGVDISQPAIEHARQLATDAGLTNVTFEYADAQVHDFPAQAYDLCISRFGTMFFADSAAAFANIRPAMRTDARLVLLVWQHRERNEWATAVRAALAIGTDSPPPPTTQHPFTLADQTATQGLLTAAGFDSIDFADVDEPVYYGPDADTAFDFVRGMLEPQELLAALGPDEQTRALDRLHQLFEDHKTAAGVLLGSRAWIITARAR